MANDIGSKTRQGVLWTAFYDAFEFVLDIGSSIILARILFPEDFGLMGIVYIAIQFARRLASFGFSTVLVQMKEVKDEHYDTVYIMNMVLMGLVTGFLFFSAPYYANFFDNQKLNLILKVIAFDFLLKAFASVPTSILKRHMNFRLLGLSDTIGRFASIFSTLIMAFSGLGVWSLVLGTMFGSFCQRTAVISFARRHTPWKPRLRFRWWALKDSFSFGTWVYISSFVHFGVNKIDFFLIGKFLGLSQLGLYERAFSLMSLPRKKIVRKVNTVLFSGFSRIQDDNERVVRGLMRVITYLSIIAYPMMIWLFFVAPSLISVLYGEKWMATVLPIQGRPFPTWESRTRSGSNSPAAMTLSRSCGACSFPICPPGIATGRMVLRQVPVRRRRLRTGGGIARMILAQKKCPGLNARTRHWVKAYPLWVLPSRSTTEAIVCRAAWIFRR